MNMIPSVPLDGGILLQKDYSIQTRYNSANKIMTVISAVFSAMIMGLAYICDVHYKIQFSLMFSALMIGNIFTQSEKYNVDLTKH